MDLATSTDSPTGKRDSKHRPDIDMRIAGRGEFAGEKMPEGSSLVQATAPSRLLTKQRAREPQEHKYKYTQRRPRELSALSRPGIRFAFESALTSRAVSLNAKKNTARHKV
jgi:hypothetical protein